MRYFGYYDSFVGVFEIGANDKYLESIHLVDYKGKEVTNWVVEATKEWFDQYFSKLIPQNPPPLAPAKTYFEERVRKVVLDISFGSCLSYKEVARAAGSPKAYRAVGQIMKRNPFMIIVPCHRVIATKGLGGYNGGIEIKKKLLEFEGCGSINL